MNTHRFDRRATLRVLAALAASPLASRARPASATWPTQPVVLVVPHPAGSGSDTVARAVARELAGLWGVSVLVDNRTGAEGATGSSLMAKAVPDGHALLVVAGSHAVDPALRQSLPYDTPIARIVVSPVVLVASTHRAYRTLNDVVEAARRDELEVGHSDGQAHLVEESMRRHSDLKTVGVAYSDGVPMVADLIGGRLPLGLTSVLTALPHIQAGNLRAIGVAADRRMALFPQAMAFSEAGLKNVEPLNWYGVFGPAAMADDVVSRIGGDLARVADELAFVKPRPDQRVQIVPTPPGGFAGFLRQETAKWTQAAQCAGT